MPASKLYPDADLTPVVRAHLTLRPDGDPNRDAVIVHARYQDGEGKWIISRAFKPGPNHADPSSDIEIPPECMPRVQEFLNANLELDRKNRATSAQEVVDFKAGKHHASEGGKYFAYFSRDLQEITTWMGDTLARVRWVGNAYLMPAFGRPSKRRNFRAMGIDGREYAGTMFLSSGTYVRMRPIKASK